MKNLEELFRRLLGFNLTLNPNYRSLFQFKVSFLSHIVSKSGVFVDPAKVSDIQQWSTPADKRQLKSFLGHCMYYRRFIPRFTDIVKPLTYLTEEGTKFD